MAVLLFCFVLLLAGQFCYAAAAACICSFSLACVLRGDFKCVHVFLH